MFRQPRGQVSDHHTRSTKDHSDLPIERAAVRSSGLPVEPGSHRAVGADNRQRGADRRLGRLAYQVDQRRDGQDRSAPASQSKRKADDKAQQ